ncbi:Growth-regulating factor 7 [Forsythia ovata]|uniref:Growth-regulating factor n=1 Tax=Forsythia ovata TaxID=205694 RepID=A0ABD1UAL5_9LAMI
MAASVGFPFTSAKMKDLERQAMIFKYMMASMPVPPHLLFLAEPNPSISCKLTLDSGFSFSCMDVESSNRFFLFLSVVPDLERCKRTDGKKWRCSRDVVPHHKYYERHLQFLILILCFLTNPQNETSRGFIDA